MALQQELLKSTAVATLALLHASGVVVLPTASITAIVLVQLFSLLHALLAPPSKAAAKTDVVASATSARASSVATRCAVGLVLLVLFARLLRFLSFCESPFQVACLACCVGAACYSVTSSSRHSSHMEQGHAGVSCPYDAAFWLNLEQTEHLEPESVLEGLVEEYYGPRSVLAHAAALEAASFLEAPSFLEAEG